MGGWMEESRYTEIGLHGKQGAGIMKGQHKCMTKEHTSLKLHALGFASQKRTGTRRRLQRLLGLSIAQ